MRTESSAPLTSNFTITLPSTRPQLLASLLVDSLTLLLLGGLIGNISANAARWSSGSFTSIYTLSMIAAGIVINVIRHSSTRSLSLPQAVTEIATLFFLGLVLSNPILWGLPVILAALLAWMIVETLRYRMISAFTWKTAIGSIFILAAVAITLNAHVADTRVYEGQVLITNANLFPIHGAGLVILTAWALAEGLWLMWLRSRELSSM